MSEKYNGWASYETWLVNLWFGDYFNDMDMDMTASFVRDTVEELIDDDYNDGGFVADLMGAALREVDWDELADAYSKDEDED